MVLLVVLHLINTDLKLIIFTVYTCLVILIIIIIKLIRIINENDENKELKTSINITVIVRKYA